ncbi:MAG TPA: glycoside hydrolase family 172 protein, partial [Candidatus Kryptonia bacterium]|nr:glycoside hydrolase family 172 protein [Candidatus Kryptonia bacterium]
GRASSAVMEPHPLHHHPLRTLFAGTGARSRRASSWDRSGGNRDFVTVGPGEVAVLLEHDGPGCITHVYCALAFPELTDYRDSILRCYWDGETTPSVEVPLGDFFALAHSRIRLIRSALISVNPGFGSSHGLNAYFPMPFATGARITLEHRGDQALGGLLRALWYHIDYETYEAPLPADALRFHAQWRQEKPTVAVGPHPNVQLHDGVNLDGADNYVALEATGAGQMIGLLLQINNVAGGWYGEGDDMVFVDGEPWPPAIHGTGTEEIFGGGACPSREYAGPYHGFHLIESPDYAGLVGAYRWFVNDPIRFTRALRWTVEHGHANNFANEYASVAYWYQTEPHAAFPALPGRDALRPALPAIYEEARAAFFGALYEALKDLPSQASMSRVAGIGELFYAGRFDETVQRLRAG